MEEKKINLAINQIDNILSNNFCEKEFDKYIDKLIVLIRELNLLVKNAKNKEEAAFFGDIIETIVLLRHIILILKGV